MSQASLLPAASAGKSRERVVVDHERHVEDFYVDPPFCTELLLKEVSFTGAIWDPCCGGGTIPKTLVKCGFPSHLIDASDLVDRGCGEGGIDFLKITYRVGNIIFNPPYVHAEKFILHALGIAEGKVAALVNIKFLASQGRRERLFKPHPPAAVLILSRRPSMPPGNSGLVAKGGTADYCWIVWNRGGHTERPAIGWLA